MTVWIIAIVAYLIITGLTWQFIVKKYDNSVWENIMISLSWICFIPFHGIMKLQEWLVNGFS